MVGAVREHLTEPFLHLNPVQRIAETSPDRTLAGLVSAVQGHGDLPQIPVDLPEPVTPHRA
jgi:hypothetical protein